MRHIVFVFAVVIGCAGMTALHAAEGQQQEQRSGCWSRVKKWLSPDEDLKRSVALAACAIVAEVHVFYPVVPPQYASWFLYGCGAGTGGLVGWLQISKKCFDHVFPRCAGGAAGALVGSTLGFYLQVTGSELSDEQIAFLSAAGFVVGTQVSTVCTKRRAAVSPKAVFL